MKQIGFIGVGIMGKSMVRNLMKAGYDLHIYARTKSKVEDVIGEGAVFHDSISDQHPLFLSQQPSDRAEKPVSETEVSPGESVLFRTDPVQAENLL